MRQMNKVDKGGRSVDGVAVAGAMHHLGILYSDQGRLNEAEAMYERALQGYTKALLQCRALAEQIPLLG